jgi:large subunit ribosomal protein L18e
MKTNPHKEKLIEKLKEHSNKESSNFWKRISKELQKSTRRTREVNLNKLNKYTKENEVIMVPGKILGTGNLDHKLTIASFSITESAKDKLKGNLISIQELIKKDPKGKNIRIIG